MTQKSEYLTSTASLPTAVIVTADDGGVGKTTLAVQVVTAFKLAGALLDLYQLDTKGKLGAKTGLPVVSMSAASASGERGDDLSPADVIAPWYRAVTAMPETRRSTLVEVGGATAPLFHAGITDLDFEEDIESLGLAVHVLVLTKAGEDSAVQTLREIKRLEANLPGAKIALVRNEMNGCPRAGAEFLEPKLAKNYLNLFEKFRSIRLPKVRARSMAIYERLHVTPDEIVSWHLDNYAEAIRRSGRPRNEAKLFVKDIAAWSGVVQDELLRLLPLSMGGADA